MSDITLALITRLVRIGVMNADDIGAMCVELNRDDGDEIMAAFVEAVTPEQRFQIINGGKNRP